MARAGAWIWVLGLLSGCAATVQERVRDYNDDGVLLFKRGEYANARECFQAALHLKPTDGNILYNIAECHDHLGQSERAEQAYRECLKADPNHADCRRDLAVLLWNLDRKSDATQMIEDWLARQPRLASALALDAWLYRQNGDLPKAKSRLQMAFAADPNNLLTLTEMGQIYEAESRPDRALYVYERALAVKPDQLELAQRVLFLKAKGVGPPRPD